MLFFVAFCISSLKNELSTALETDRRHAGLPVFTDECDMPSCLEAAPHSIRTSILQRGLVEGFYCEQVVMTCILE